MRGGGDDERTPRIKFDSLKYLKVSSTALYLLYYKPPDIIIIIEITIGQVTIGIRTYDTHL